MRKLVAVGLFLAAAGCASSEQEGGIVAVHKTGSTFTQRVAAFDQCKIASFRDIPHAPSTQGVGAISQPGTVMCSNVGSTVMCNNVGGYTIPGRVVTTDANDDLRARFISRCLQGKGFRLVSARLCRTDAEKQKAAASLDKQPAAIGCVGNRTLDRGFVY